MPTNGFSYTKYFKVSTCSCGLKQRPVYLLFRSCFENSIVRVQLANFIIILYLNICMYVDYKIGWISDIIHKNSNEQHPKGIIRSLYTRSTLNNSTWTLKPYFLYRIKQKYISYDAHTVLYCKCIFFNFVWNLFQNIKHQECA